MTAFTSIESIFADRTLYEYDPKFKCKPLDGLKLYSKSCGRFNSVGDIRIPIKLRYDFTKYFTGFDLKKNGIVIAGGYFTSAEIGYHKTDIDLFIIAESRDEAITKIINLLYYLNTLPSYRHTYLVTRNCITIQLSHHETFQIICRYFPNIMAIFDTFDISAACVAYDGEKCYMNAESVYTFATATIIYNPKRRHNNFVARLKKYYERGFAVLFDPNKVTKENNRHLFNGFVIDAGGNFNAIIGDRELPYYCGLPDPDTMSTPENRLKFLYKMIIKKSESGIFYEAELNEIIMLLKESKMIDKFVKINKDVLYINTIHHKGYDCLQLTCSKIDNIPHFNGSNFKINIAKIVFDYPHKKDEKIRNEIIMKECEKFCRELEPVHMKMEVLPYDDPLWLRINPIIEESVYIKSFHLHQDRLQVQLYYNEEPLPEYTSLAAPSDYAIPLEPPVYDK